MKEFVIQGTGGEGSKKIDYKAELNEQQYEAVVSGDGSALILAGAGSGKTRVITYRVSWLLEHGVDPARILLLTFTNRAAREMIERVESLIGHYPNGLWSGTFHSVANRILRRYATKLGYTSNFSILDQEDARDLVSICTKELKIDTKNKRFPNSSVLHSIISFSRNKNCSVEEAVESMHPKFLPILHEIEAVTGLYAKSKRQQNSMDFDDLLLLFLELLESRPEVKQELGTQFEFILVDEFQDTNVIQARIVRHLSEVHQNLFVVGDDAQSIYSFRAADIQNILSFPNQYQGVKTYRLTKNYRSTPQILTLANEVISNNTEQFKKDLEAAAKDGAKPELVPASSTRQEAEFIAEQIIQLQKQGMELREIAVLFRATFHSQSLEFELMKRDIPYDYRGGLKFFERSHIKDIVAHIRVANNVKDAMAWVRILRIHPGIGLVTANKIAGMAGEVGALKAALGIQLKAKKASAGFAGAKRILSGIVEARPFPSDYIRAVAASADYQAYLENEFPNYQERLDDLEQFAIFAEQFQDFETFLEAVSLTDDFSAVRDQQVPDDTDRIILSTVHQAKGLEWDAVFVMHLAEGSFPHKRAMEDEDQLQEERRLFYVAVTRARKRLFLSYPATKGYEHVEICLPSAFLEEIPDDLVERVQLKQAFGGYGNYAGSGGYGSNGYAKKGGYGASGGTAFKSSPTTAKPKTQLWDDSYEEESIQLDEFGEPIEPEAPKTSFLRSIDEL